MENKMTGLDFKIREVAGRIRDLREVNGLSIEEMAQRTGTTVEEYLACESGDKNLSIAFLYRCVLIFGGVVLAQLTPDILRRTKKA